MSYKVRVDWLTATGKVGADEKEIYEGGILQSAKLAHALVCGFGVQNPSLQTVSPQRHYKYAFVDRQSKLRVNIGENLLQQGWKVEASGYSCQELDVNAFLPAFVEVWSARITRFDVAVDLIDTGLVVSEFAEDCAEEWGYDGGRLWHFRKGKTGNTCYIGAPASERHMRFYDKGGEQGIPIDWMRCEMEYKGGFAQHAYETYFHNYKASVAQTIDFISLPNSGLCKILDKIAMGEVSEKLVKPRVVGDRAKWFNTQVYAAYVKLCEENPQAALEIWEKFHQTYIAHEVYRMYSEGIDKIRNSGYDLER